MNVNKTILAGRITRDIELRRTQGGMAVAKFGMAVNRKRRNEESVMFIDCVAFEKAGELIHEHCKKGSPLFIEGRLELQQWESDDGSRRSKHEVIVEHFQFMGGDREEQQGRRSGGGRTQQQSTGGSDGDIPF